MNNKMKRTVVVAHLATWCLLMCLSVPALAQDAEEPEVEPTEPAESAEGSEGGRMQGRAARAWGRCVEATVWSSTRA